MNTRKFEYSVLSARIILLAESREAALFALLNGSCHGPIYSYLEKIFEGGKTLSSGSHRTGEQFLMNFRFESKGGMERLGSALIRVIDTIRIVISKYFYFNIETNLESIPINSTINLRD